MHAPVTLSLAGLAAHMMFLRLPSGDKLVERLSADFRVHVLVLHLITMVTLALIRCWLASRRPRPRPPPTLRPPEAAPGVATTSGTEFPNGGDAPGPDVRRRAEGNLVID
ncbi:unnamed protein product [Polarella glacialis]|uniref:Uncharacterized protein n=1 Tax=Polarella glacialis TaxID=89957 RepID=A0A813H4E0_POLGL|nr:unnamed protein product [Polarella glacialis]